MRSSGILLHISSLPGRYGIGTLGRYAFEFVDTLKKSRQTYWQILPIGPTGYGDSPYQSYSAFAGNPNLIDMDKLIHEGLIDKDDVDLKTLAEKSFYDYAQLFSYKKIVLIKACKAFLEKDEASRIDRFNDFCSENAFWLDDYALFMTIKTYFNQTMWTLWDDDFRLRDEDTITAFSKAHAAEITQWKFMQFIFFEQYNALKRYANRKGIKIYGDMPIYVSMDSADIWAHPEMFDLDEDRRPIKVAGCPPDPFAPTGQLWGNPLYNWKYLEKNGFDWWVQRVKYSSQLFDLTRIDHFRGFESYYAIPAEDKTAENGEWLKGPAMKLFDAIKEQAGDVALVAEDLGFLTDSVKEMLKAAGYPGMNVLEFAFGGDDSQYLPHNHSKNSVVYIGTHDNDTALGWYRLADDDTKRFMKRYLGLKKITSEKKAVKALIRALYASPADTCIIQMQDVLRLGSDARMNIPSTVGGKNWAWRLEKLPGKKDMKAIRELTQTYFRCSGK
ncbi:MAG: 4-alpha-glucanotransferase [Oscillospiraceae bacterium]|nr:4-alpha-glucanotransferase [Oscillospiraceae bacterium]